MNEGLPHLSRPTQEGIAFHPKTETRRTGNQWNWVVKIGGSLFDCVELTERLSHLLKHLREPVLLVAGGGGFADEVRRLDEIHQWPAAFSHQLAIQAMSLGATILGAQLQLPVFTTDADLQCMDSPATSAVVDVARLQVIEELSSGWETTSDSIAAHLATRFSGGRLLLVKSTELNDSDCSPIQLSTLELVDQAFPQFAAGLQQLAWVNLRSRPLKVQPIPLRSADAGEHRSLPRE